MTKFRQKLTTTGSEHRLELSGVLDEDSELLPLADELMGAGAWGERPSPPKPIGDTIAIDLAAIERMNQAGAALWHDFVELLDQNGLTVKLSRCSPAVVAHLNRTGVTNVTVESFAMPYFCPECDESRTLWADEGDLGDSIEPPVKRCPECDLVMQFDDDASTYFGFLGAGHRARVKAATSQPLVALEAEGSAPFLFMVVAVAVVIVGAALALFLAN